MPIYWRPAIRDASKPLRSFANATLPLNLSRDPDLRTLSGLVDDMRRAVPDVPFILAGATARDVILKHAYRVDTGRATLDVDMAFAVRDWAAYENLRKVLVASGRFIENPRQRQSVRHQGPGKSNVDVIPFAGVEDESRQIAWPPDGSMVMSVMGFQEAASSAETVVLPGGTTIAVASLAAQMLLKLAAWRDRRLRQPGKDAQDIRLLLRTYPDAGNHERIFEEAAHLLLTMKEFDYDAAGAWLLGADARRVATADSHGAFARIVAGEVGSGAESRLVADMRSSTPAHDLTLLQAFQEGFTGQG